MTENQFGPRGGEADDQTRVSYPRSAGSQGQPAPGAPQGAPQQQSYQAPQPQPQPYQAAQSQQPYQGGSYGQGQQPAYQPAGQTPRPKAGYFRSLFDLSYDNLGAAKFARVFQLLFMIVSGIAALVAIVWGLKAGTVVLFVIVIVVVPLLWLLINTLVRLTLEAVVGIVQTAENSEQMLEIMRTRERA